MGSRTIITKSSTTYTSKTRTTANYYNSRTPSRSPVNNYDDLRMRSEEERQRRIKENKEYIAEIQATNEEVKKTRDMISQAQSLLANAVGGEKYKEYSRYLMNQDEMLQQITDGLNACGEKAATNIRNDGEIYTFNQINTNSNENNINNNKNTLSANTNELRKLEILLDNINRSTKNIDTKMPKISNDSTKLGITNSKGIQESSQDLVKNTGELKNKLTEQIQNIERTEKENLNIVERIRNYFGELFKLPDKEQNSQTRTTVSTRTTTRTPILTRTTTPRTTIHNSIDVNNIKNANKLYELWKANIEYGFSCGSIQTNGRGTYTYYMLEPENPESNIPTVFCLDGDCQSKLANTGVERIKGLITGDTQSDYEQRFFPLAAITQGGLTNPNIRTIYIPNPTYSGRMCATGTSTFEEIVGVILTENPQIDTNNMSICGHSAGGKAATQFAAESEKYKFKNVVMISSYWQQENKISEWMGTAISKGTKFYGSYSKCDTNYPTDEFMKEHLSEYSQREPWYFSDSTSTHGQTYWDFFTYDGDNDGKADTVETIWGED